MNTKILYDTNAYRILASKKDINELEEQISNIEKYETSHHLEPCFSVVVAMELIDHLQNEVDKNFIECYDALYILARHVRINKNSKFFKTSQFIAGLDDLLEACVEGKYSIKSQVFYEQLQQLIFVLTSVYNPDFCKAHLSDIKKVANENNQIKINFEENIKEG